MAPTEHRAAKARLAGWARVNRCTRGRRVTGLTSCTSPPRRVVGSEASRTGLQAAAVGDRISDGGDPTSTWPGQLAQQLRGELVRN